MEIAVLRDWVIVIFGFLGIGAILIFLVMLFIIYRKVTAILDAVKETIDTVRDTTNAISDAIIQPIIKIKGFIAGFRKAAEILFSTNKKG
ncbi:MAG: hypothetical protein WC749_12110 [Dehalococcoidia bacterium]